MPIYEYACDRCGTATDLLQKVSDPAPTQCAHCGADGALRKVVGRTSFVLKGGGWYADLYGSSKPKSESASSGGT
jgi:putative FmdB family regulatory protein